MKKSLFLAALLPMAVLAEADKAPEREVLKLAPEYEAHVRYEMRGFLVSLQGINEALAKQDFEAVARYARQSGRSAPAQGPRGLGKALPERFRELGGATHAAFDQLAVDAETMGDARVIAEHVSSIMKNCIQCHATYRFGK
jgi:mono/diheme cytochrome c family protein